VGNLDNVHDGTTKTSLIKKKQTKKRQCQVLRRHRFSRDLRFGFICRGHLTRRTFQGGAGGGRGSGLCFRFGFRLGVAGTAPPRMMIIPLFIGVLTIPGGCLGFRPSTVSIRLRFIYQNYTLSTE